MILKRIRYNSELFYEQYICTKMETYCLNCKKYTENIDPKISDTSNGKTMILSKSAISNSKKSKQEAKRLLSKLDIKTPLSKIPILDDILF